MRARPLVLLALLLALPNGGVGQQPAPSFRQLIREGQRLRSTGNLRGASSKYDAAIEVAANDQELAEALHAHAIAQRGLGRNDQAEADLRRAIALPGAGALRRPAMMQLAALLEAENRLDEAIALYRQVAASLRDRPEESADALLAALRLLVDNGRLPEAREALADLKPEALPPGLRSEAAGLRLEVYLGSGDIDAARTAIAEAGLEGPQLAQLHVRLARVLLEGGRVDEALRACDDALAADPGSPAAWRAQYDIAAAQGAEGRLLEAVEALLRADPDNEQLAQRLASYAEWDQDAERALGAFRALLALRPNDANLLERAGGCAAQFGRGAEALEFYQAALQLQPDDTGLYYLVGEVQAKLGNRAGAVAALKQGTRFRAGDEESARRLGTALVRSGLYDEAAAVYRETREAVGDPEALAYEMAEALSPVQPAEALGEYVRAAAASLDDADIVAPEAVKLARNADLLPRLSELTAAALEQRRAPGLALLLATAEAAQGQGLSAVRRAEELGLSPQDLMLIAESLEGQGAREAAAEAYAAVVAHPQASSGLRLELGVRAAEAQIASGRREEARAVLEAALRGNRGPEPLAERALFLLADLDLAAGRNLAQVRDVFLELAQRGSLPDLSRQARWRLADVAFAEGDYAGAEGLYAQLAVEPPGLEIALPPPPPGLSVLRNGLPLPPGMLADETPQAEARTTPAYAAVRGAECAFRRGEFDRAKALFAQVAEQYPDSVYANDAVERRLFIATHFSNPRPATEAYLVALARSLTDGWSASVAGLLDLAQAGLAEPLADDAALLAASIQESHGRLAEAAAGYRAFPTTFAGSLLAPEALLNAARLARTLGDQTQAREDLTDLLRNYPDAPMARTAALWLDDLQQGRPWPAP